jgi:hypothetical protein
VAFPRGWSIPLPAPGYVSPGGTVSLSNPALPGIAHVLTAINFAMTVGGSASGNAISITVTSGAISEFLGWIAQPTAAGTVETFTWTGTIQGILGTAIAVSVNSANAANTYASLEIQGFDI